MINNRVNALRSKMKNEGVTAYLVTGTDPHQSEYVAPRWRDRAFISGFTGSAGTVVVTDDKALLWVDSRYFIQAAEQIKNSEYTLMKLDTDNTPSPEDWMLDNLSAGDVVGTADSYISIKKFDELSKKLKKKNVELRGTSDLIDSIWSDRPAIPFSSLREVALEYAGQSCEDKLDRVRKILEVKEADYTFIASIDDIAWITNLRGDDIEHNPVFMSFLFISKEKAVLFTSLKRFSEELLSSIKGCFEVYDYNDVDTMLPQLAKGVAYYNPDRVSHRFAAVLEDEEAITGLDITTTLKARKNVIEMRGMRRSHLMDGVAFVNFLAKLNRNPDGSLDEIAVSTLLEKERERLEGYLGPSFAPISGFAEHGAMCHYSATPDSSKKIDKDGLLVLDTGSQFYYGMTDITRTLLFGKATEEQKRDYTLVLKGHLALAAQRFIAGTKGYQLDVLAKQFMWMAGESFYHGTGHGVGFNLNVHEGPMNISPRAVDVKLESGMVVSDEPGIYKEGRHGIRIENLIAVQEDVTTEFGAFNSFEVLTLVPYEKALIDLSIMTDSEISQVNAYHKWCHDELISLVDEEAKAYLEEATSPLVRE